MWSEPRHMLLKHSGYYMLARGLPGIINFLAIAAYTRMLSPDEYGLYALITAAVGFFNVVFFRWIQQALQRFLPAYLDNPRPLLSNILGSFSILVLLTGCLGLLLAWLWPDPTWRGLILLAVLLLWVQSWFELDLSLSATKLLPLRYGLINGVKAVISLTLGIFLVSWCLGAYGPLIGLLLGMLLPSVLWGWREWKGLTPMFSQPYLSKILHYGLPLTATFALVFVVDSSDRFLIAWFLGEGPTGVYAASYDLGLQTLSLLMTVVNIAAYPLTVRALEQKGIKTAQEQLSQNAILLLAIAVPAAVGMAVLAPNMSAVLLGISFREDATHLLPWVALAILLGGIKANHFDLAFQLGQNTMGQLWVSGAAALLNIILNLLWIPIFGLMGAAYATFVTFLLALLLSAAMGRRSFVLPIPYRAGLKITFASILMGLLLSFTLTYQGPYALIAQVILGVIIYIIILFLLNVGNSRTKLLGRPI